MVNLTIGGGSLRGIAFVGSLEYLYSNNYISIIDNFYGCSVGSIIGILYLIGYKPLEILNELLNINLENAWDFNLNNINTNYSLLGNTFFELMNELFLKKESNKKITIKEFCTKYSVNINIYSVSIKQRKVINFNQHSYPDLEVLIAIKASCSIPILFPPVKIGSDLFIDGCSKCLTGCYDANNGIKSGYIIKLNDDYSEINNLTDYISELFKCILVNEEYKCTKNTIEIKFNKDYENKMAFNDLTHSDKIYLFYEGLSQTKSFFNYCNN